VYINVELESNFFAFSDLDIVLCHRLAKQSNENKFTFLFEAYERIDNHIVAKRKGNEEKVKEMKNITARYFVSCLTCPDMFEIENEIKCYFDLCDQKIMNQ